MTAIPRGATAVMTRRVEPPDSLDFFPTPPWATRALCEHLDRWGDIAKETAWDPACGEGHMVRPLAEYFQSVYASDVHDYSAVFPGQHRVTDFLIEWDRPAAAERPRADWIITNPPFRLAEAFVLRALAEADVGVAMLVRTTFLEGGGRHERLFAQHPPEWILQFCERVPMHRGRLEANGSTATAYCWLVWLIGSRRPRGPGLHFPAFVWIPPCRRRLERAGDYAPARTDEGGGR